MINREELNDVWSKHCEFTESHIDYVLNILSYNKRILNLCIDYYPKWKTLYADFPNLITYLDEHLLFFIEEDNGSFTVADNSTGDLFVENFDNKEQALLYLNEDINLNYVLDMEV